MKKLVLSAVAAAFLASCSSSSSQPVPSNSQIYKQSYSHIQKTASLPEAALLYPGAALESAKAPAIAQKYTAAKVLAAPSSAEALSLPAGWDGGERGKDVIVGIIDAGVTHRIAQGFEGYYVYDASVRAGWPSDADRVRGSAEEHHSYSMPQVIDPNCGAGVCEHGEEVAAVVHKFLPDALFANITHVNPEATGDGVDVGATLDNLSRRGVRVFNRSLGVEQAASVAAEGDFLTAIYFNDALVINSAGNREIGGQISQNALSPGSPLHRGWIIALGYELGGDKYFINAPNAPGGKIFVRPAANSCKQIGLSDCIAAPYSVVVRDEFATSGRALKLSGTSFSAPAVSAAAAAVIARYPWMSNEQVKQTLFSTAFAVQGGTEAERRAHFGAGLLNAAGAMAGPARFDDDFVANVDDGLFVFSNDISGAGGLVKTGPGTLALMGKNTFSGEIFNADGALWLAGQNAADVDNSALLRLKNARVGFLRNDAKLFSEGFSASHLALGAASELFVNIGEIIEITGGANLAGELNIVGVKDGYALLSGLQEETILRADAIAGRFDAARSLSPFLALEGLHYGAQEISAQLRMDSSLSKLPELNAYARQNYASLINALGRRAAAVEHSAQTASTALAATGGRPVMSQTAMVGGFTNPAAYASADSLALAGDFAGASAKSASMNSHVQSLADFASQPANSPRDSVANSKFAASPDALRFSARAEDLAADSTAKFAADSAAITPPDAPEIASRPEDLAHRAINQLFALNSEQVTALAPVLFAERSGALVANKIAAARALQNAFSQPEMSILGAFAAQTKAAEISRNLYGVMFSLSGEPFTSVLARVSGLAATDSEQADIRALSGSLDISLSDRLSMQFDAGAYFHSDEIDSQGFLGAMSLSFYQPFNAYTAAGFRLGIDLNHLHNDEHLLAPARVEEQNITLSSQYARAFLHLKTPRLFAMFSAGARTNNQFEYKYSGLVENARINNIIKVLDRTNYLAGVNLRWNMSRRASLLLDLNSEFAKEYYVNSAQFGFNFYF